MRFLQAELKFTKMKNVRSVNDMSDSSVVVIPLQRYDELLKAETRINVIVERLTHNEFLSNEDILWLLDTELSVELAQELHEKA